MKKQIVYVVLLFSISLFSQAPQSFNYQSVIKDSGGNTMSNQNVGIQFIIHQTSAAGLAVYTETWTVTTNAYGVLNTSIGLGTTSDDFSTINWGSGPYYLEVLLDMYGGTNYVSTGTSQLMSTPYALHAEYAANDAINDADADATNEIQDLSHTINDTNRTINITSGTETTFSIADNDNDASNEIQDLSRTINGINRTINITGGTGTTFSIADNDSNSSNEIQNLSNSFSGTNRTIGISDGTSTTFNIADNDNSASNELQTLNFNGTTLSLSQGGGAVNLANIGVEYFNNFSGTENIVDAGASNAWETIATPSINLQGSNNYLVFVSFRCKIQGGSGDDLLNFRISAVSTSCSDSNLDSTGLIETLKEHRGEYGLVSFRRVLNLTNNCQYNVRLQVSTDDSDDDIHFDDAIITAIKIK